MVADKNVSDAMEAMIGAYLLVYYSLSIVPCSFHYF